MIDTVAMLSEFHDNSKADFNKALSILEKLKENNA